MMKKLLALLIVIAIICPSLAANVSQMNIPYNPTEECGLLGFLFGCRRTGSVNVESTMPDQNIYVFAGDGGNETGNGSSWYSGTGIPDDGQGWFNDYYLRTTGSPGAGYIYNKSNLTEWTFLFSIMGPTGPQGPQGDPGEMNQTANMTAGPQGEPGAANMTAGPQGEQGIPGAANMTANMTAGPQGEPGEPGAANMTAGPQGPEGPMNMTMNLTMNLTMNQTPNWTFNLTPNWTFNLTPNWTINLTMNQTFNLTPNLTANMTMNLTINQTPNWTMNLTMNQTMNWTFNLTPNWTFNLTPNWTMNLTMNQTFNLTPNLTANMTAGPEGPQGEQGIQGPEGPMNMTMNLTMNLTMNQTPNWTFNLTPNWTANMTMNLTMNQTINLTSNMTMNLTPGIGLPNITIMAQSMIPTNPGGATITAPNSTGTPNLTWVSVDFPNGSRTNVSFAYTMPGNYDGGTITYQYVWTYSGTASGTTVTMGLQGKCAGDGDSIAGPLGTGIETTDTAQDPLDVLISPVSSAVTLEGTPAANNVCWFLFYRNGGGLATSAHVLSLRVGYNT